MTFTQNTLAKSASISGSSLHTGEQVTLTIHPAPPGHGRKFRRKDLPDHPVIEARIDLVKTVERLLLPFKLIHCTPRKISLSGKS